LGLDARDDHSDDVYMNTTTPKRQLTEAERSAEIAAVHTKLEAIKAELAELDWLAPYRAQVAEAEKKLADLTQSVA
jgi:hypothetical protein